MSQETRIDLIHLSDLQLGARCRFPQESAAGDLRRALVDDLHRLEQSGHLDAATPRLIAVTGDIADAALPAEYERARDLLLGLADDLGMPPGRTVVVPGNHDVSWLKCRHHFEECEMLGSEPVAPYYPKLVFFEHFFASLYGDLPATERPTFSQQQPWTISTFADLGLQVLGVNSCWQERHGKDPAYHYGWVGQDSLRAMLDAARVTPQPLTVALVHHNPLPDLVKETASLRQGRQVLDRLAESGVRLLLCGHGHLADAVGYCSLLGGRQMAVLAGGSVAVSQEERAESVRNQYQVVQLGERPRVLRRCYDPHRGGGRFEADPVDNEWCCGLPPWVCGQGEAPPPPTVEALITAYREHCRRSYQELVGSLYRRRDQVGHPLIADVFVPLKVRAEPPRQDEGEAERGPTGRGLTERGPTEAVSIDDSLQSSGHAPLLLAGGAGSGKTTYLRHSLCSWASGEDTETLTLYVPLGRLGDHLAGSRPGVQRLWAALAAFLAEEEAPFSAKQLASLAAEGRLELLLDGLDELRSDLRPAFTEALTRALAKAAGKVPVVLTSRPYALADAGALPGFAERRILDLDDDQRRDFLQRYHQRLFEPIPARAAAESERLRQAMATHRALYNLGRTPLMLLGLAVVHYREGRLPHGRDEVFRALTEAVLELRFASEQERQRQTRRLQAIALALHERQEHERDVSLPVLSGLVERVLRDETGEEPCANDLQACLDQLLGICGLLEADRRGARFLHLGFQEYLAAEALSHRLQGRFTAEGVHDRYLDDEWWRETMAMLVSLLSRGATGYEGVKLWREIFTRRRQGKEPVARLAQLAESLLEIEPRRRPELATEEAELVGEIVAVVEDRSQPGRLEDRVAAAEALGRLGDPRCSHLPPAMVDVGNGLEVGAYPVTVAQFRGFVEASGYQPELFGEERYAAWQAGIDELLADPDYKSSWERIRSTRSRSAPAWWAEQLWTPTRPVVGISWFEACAFCDWLTGEEGGAVYRLPSEQEWQRAAAGAWQNKPYPWGGEDPGKGSAARANYYHVGLSEPRPTPVGLFPSGAADWGEAGRLCDIAGNVWEWCDDTLSEQGHPLSTREQSDVGGSFRPLRGGACWNVADFLEVSCRRRNHAADWNGRIGFRVVRCGSCARPPAVGG